MKYRLEDKNYYISLVNQNGTGQYIQYRNVFEGILKTKDLFLENKTEVQEIYDLLISTYSSKFQAEYEE